MCNNCSGSVFIFKTAAMRKFIPLLVLSFHMINGCAQSPVSDRGEFATNTNGLMYNDGDMKTLRFIVDSLNLRFKTCDLNKKYYTTPQARVYAVSFRSDTNDLKAIISDMNNNVLPSVLASRYKSFISSTDTSKLIIKNGNDSYLSGNPYHGYDGISLTEKNKIKNSDFENKWTYIYYTKKDYQKYYSLNCYFFSTSFTSMVLPDNYEKLIQYVDCMIDTASVIYLTDKYDRDGFSSPGEYHSRINNYLNSAMKIKRQGKEDWEYNYLSNKKITHAKQNLLKDRYFISLVEKAAEDFEESGKSDDALEELIGFFISKEKALHMKRSRRVIGQCSQDQSPREHARNIAILAAEAHSWDIFLRAHLDIMNDRFERMSDGSYAWGQRQTYLKELEELNLNVVDLMLGLTLRAENVAENHYYGTVWRMGKALTESREKELFEQKAITIMKDETLDEFNRGLIFLLYSTYTNYLSPEEGKLKRDALRKTIDSFPEFIRKAIIEMKEPKVREG